MVVASCNELTNETLLRSTLFGHRRGAFTDARDDRPGLVVSAGRGMVLLDDFHRLPTAGTADPPLIPRGRRVFAGSARKRSAGTPRPPSS